LYYVAERSNISKASFSKSPVFDVPSCSLSRYQPVIYRNTYNNTLENANQRRLRLVLVRISSESHLHLILWYVSKFDDLTINTMKNSTWQRSNITHTPTITSGPSSQTKERDQRASWGAGWLADLHPRSADHPKVPHDLCKETQLQFHLHPWFDDNLIQWRRFGAPRSMGPLKEIFQGSISTLPRHPYSTIIPPHSLSFNTPRRSYTFYT
jgi:hypothetical protein